MIEKLIIDEMKKLKYEIDKIDVIKEIDCITIFPSSEREYEILNNMMSVLGNVIDKMSSGNLFYIELGIDTLYGKLHFIKIRKFDEKFINYRLSIDFTVEDYIKFKSNISNANIKTYENFELIQFENENSIINIVSMSAKEEYKL